MIWRSAGAVYSKTNAMLTRGYPDTRFYLCRAPGIEIRVLHLLDTPTFIWRDASLDYMYREYFFCMYVTRTRSCVMFWRKRFQWTAYVSTPFMTPHARPTSSPAVICYVGTLSTCTLCTGRSSWNCTVTRVVYVLLRTSTRSGERRGPTYALASAKTSCFVTSARTQTRVYTERLECAPPKTPPSAHSTRTSLTVTWRLATTKDETRTRNTKSC